MDAAAQADREEDTSAAKQSDHTGILGATVGRLSSALTAPFRKAAHSVVTKIVGDFRAMQEELAEAGLSFQGSWLAITVGTYVGISVIVHPLGSEVSAKSTEKLSLFQRVLLSALVKAHQVASSASDLEVSRLALTLSGTSNDTREFL